MTRSFLFSKEYSFILQKLPILSRSLQWSSFFFRKWQLYIATIGGSSLTFTLAPLFFEYTAELAYPVDEGLLGGFLTCFNNVTGGIFLCLFFIPNIGTTWMNYALLGSSIGIQFKFVSHTPTHFMSLINFSHFSFHSCCFINQRIIPKIRCGSTSISI